MTQDEILITISYIENIPGNYRVYSCSIRVPKSHWEFSRGLYIHCWFTILCISFVYNYNFIYVYHSWEIGKLRTLRACECFLHVYGFVLAPGFNEAACCISFSVAI